MFSFATRKKQNEVQRLLRRAMDTTSPNRPPLDGELRGESRSNRTLPVLLVACVDGRPTAEERIIALTKDFSSRGVAVVLPQPFRAEHVLIAFWLEGHPEFVRGQVRQNVPLGGGYWQLGVELTERLSIATSPELGALLPLAARLEV